MYFDGWLWQKGRYHIQFLDGYHFMLGTIFHMDGGKLSKLWSISNIFVQFLRQQMTNPQTEKSTSWILDFK